MEEGVPMPVSEPTMPHHSSRLYRSSVVGMCLWRACVCGAPCGLEDSHSSSIAPGSWPAPPPVLQQGHAEQGVGGAMMSPEQIHFKRPFSEGLTTGQFFALCTILPDHFWEQHLIDPHKSDFIIAGMKTNFVASSPLQK